MMKTGKLICIAITFFAVTIAACDKDDDKSQDPIPEDVTDAITDADGNVYTTVTIGTQVWMVENLKTTKYNDGTPIPNVTNDAEWVGLTTGAYCNYNNDAAIANKCGRLYNWYAVNTNKLAPKGWHIPTVAEWTILQNYLIAQGYNYDGTTSKNKIGKSLAAKTDWVESAEAGAVGNNPSTNNRTGFNALPVSTRAWTHSNGQFDELGEHTSWWSSTLFPDADLVYIKFLSNRSGALCSEENEFTTGSSVRCIKD